MLSESCSLSSPISQMWYEAHAVTERCGKVNDIVRDQPQKALCRECFRREEGGVPDGMAAEGIYVSRSGDWWRMRRVGRCEGVKTVVGQRDPEMERLIEDEPDDPDNWLVYADWLQEHDNTQGEAYCRLKVKQATCEHDFSPVLRSRAFCNLCGISEAKVYQERRTT